MLKKVLTASLLTALVATAAQAQSLYGELSYTALDYKEDGFQTAKPDAVRGIIGYEINSWLAAEGMLGLGMSKDKINAGGINMTLKADNMVGLYLKPKAKLGDAMEVFARVGFARTKVTAATSAAGIAISASSNESDLSYGVGASYAFNPKTAVTLDYMSYFSKDGAKANGLSVGVNFKF